MGEVGRSESEATWADLTSGPSRRTGLGAGAGAGYSGATGKLPSPLKQSPSACRALRAKRSISHSGRQTARMKAAAAAAAAGKAKSDKEEDELIIVNRALLPLSKLRDYVPTPVNKKQAQEQKLAAALEELNLGGAVEVDQNAAKLTAALAKREEEAELARRKPTRTSLFEKFLLADSPQQEKVACHLFQFLSSKDLVHAMTTTMRLLRFATSLQFTKPLRVAEVIRLGETAFIVPPGRGKKTAVAVSSPEKRTVHAPTASYPVNLGLLRGCSLLIGGSGGGGSGGGGDGGETAGSSDGNVDQSGDVVSADAVAKLSAFFANTSKDACVVESLAVQVDSTVNDLSIQAFVKLLSKPLLTRLRTLSLEGCTMGVPGMQVLCDTMRKKCLPVLTTLNVSRTHAQYLGIHKLGGAISSGCCPFLSTLRMSSNYARSAVFEFFDVVFASKTKFLMRIEAQDNECDLMDPEIIAILNKGMTTWRNLLLLDLSFNPLGDAQLCNKVLKQVWPLTPKDYPENFHAGLTLESLCLQGCNVGVNSASYLAQVWMQSGTPAGAAPEVALTSLNLGMNELDLTSLKRLVEPLVARKFPALRELVLTLNLLEPEGVVLIMNAVILGALDSLHLLDVSDVGGNGESISLLARALVQRWQNKQLELTRLKIMGRSPFAGRSVRVLFGKDFLEHVAVS